MFNKIKKDSIEKVINKYYDTLEDKMQNISKELVIKEIENLPPVEDEYTDEDIIESRIDVKAYLSGKLKKFASAENDEYKVVILSNTRFLYIRKDDINHPVPRHFWLQEWDSHYEREFGIDKEQYDKLSQKEKGILESKLQLLLWINEEYYIEYASFYFPKEYDIWYDEIYTLCEHKITDYRSCINEHFKQKLQKYILNRTRKPSRLTYEDIFDTTTTGMSYYDAMIQKGHIAGNRDPVEYFKTNKGLTFKTEWMSPEEYLEKSFEIHRNVMISAGLHELSLERYMEINITPDLIQEYTKRTLEGSKMPMPVLDYNNMTQEGRHRAVVAMELGVEEIPVLIVKPYEE